MPRVRTLGSPALAPGRSPVLHAGIGAAEEAVAGEEDMITLGDSTDKNLVDRKIMVTHYYQESLVIRQSGK
jgi:hypothetical protein